MSDRARDWVWRSRGLTPRRRVVLLALAHHADGDGEIDLPALGVLERMSGLSRRGIVKTLNALQAAGLIARGRGECDGSARYRLLLDGAGSAPAGPGNKPEAGSKHVP
jgi:DNA-binding MarR family transcriptional regulator